MGRLYISTLSGPKIFKCSCCKVDSASHNDIVSKDFQGRHGRAYLFRKAFAIEQQSEISTDSIPFCDICGEPTNTVNICLGPNEERSLVSGLHTVNDIYCSSCHQILGWRYEKAYEESQKYKEGLYILEKGKMLKHGW